MNIIIKEITPRGLYHLSKRHMLPIFAVSLTFVVRKFSNWHRVFDAYTVLCRSTTKALKGHAVFQEKQK